MAADADSFADYSFLDRLLHRMAFAHPALQRALGEIESDIFAAKFESQRIERPIFVTGLPRSGTTLLLELLHRTGEFATFTYREMPFPLAPLFWSSMTRSARKESRMRERAHGDGMEISIDSPEAFEEILWLAYLRRSFLRDRNLSPVTADQITPDFRDAFVRLVRKLAASQSAGGALRYLSKNNANICRLGALRSIFSDSVTFICLREPHSHVRSLMNQHRRFLALHERDNFARSYMRWIGHYDFGANFRPIDFAGHGNSSDPASSSSFWLQYWIDAYEFAARNADAGQHFVCYERLLNNPEIALSTIAKVAGLSAPDALTTKAAMIRAPTSEAAPLDTSDFRLVNEATALYRSLSARAL